MNIVLSKTALALFRLHVEQQVQIEVQPKKIIGADMETRIGLRYDQGIEINHVRPEGRGIDATAFRLGGGMMSRAGRRWAVVIVAGLLGSSHAQTSGEAARPLGLDDFAGGMAGWKFVGGEEFPGAKGSLTLDPKAGVDGGAGLRLDADFRGGGVYVGCWRDLTSAGLPEITGFRLQVRAANVKRLGVRLVDQTGQCHQGAVDLPAGSADGWRELVIPVSAIVGGEHWGGVNDGVWHGVPKGLGLNLGKDQVGPTTAGQASLVIDSVAVDPAPSGLPTLHAARITPLTTRPGFGVRVAYEWDAEPLGVDCSVFVHLIDAQGRMAFQADHGPRVPTAHWSGRVAYARTITVPTDAKPGTYDVVIGLWDGRPGKMGGGRKPFRVGDGLAVRPDNACRIGSFTVNADAPLPTLAPPTLNLDPYRLTFDEDFRDPLSVSAWGPGTRWIAHTPYAGDFGDAGFGDPGPNSPFSVREGILRIEATRVAGKWRSGLLCSVDPKGNDFRKSSATSRCGPGCPRGSAPGPRSG